MVWLPICEIMFEVVVSLAFGLNQGEKKGAPHGFGPEGFAWLFSSK